MRSVSAKAEIMYYDLGHSNMGGIEADVEKAGFISTIVVRPRDGSNRSTRGCQGISCACGRAKAEPTI
jgi:hypothetical protein